MSKRAAATMQQVSKFSAAELAAIQAGAKRAKTQEDLRKEVRDQSKTGISFKAFVLGVQPYDRSAKLSLDTARVTFVPLFPNDFKLPEAYKTMTVEREKIGGSADAANGDAAGAAAAEDGQESRIIVVNRVFPNKNSRENYDVKWRAFREPLKHFELLWLVEQARLARATHDAAVATAPQSDAAKQATANGGVTTVEAKVAQAAAAAAAASADTAANDPLVALFSSELHESIDSLFNNKPSQWSQASKVAADALQAAARSANKSHALAKLPYALLRDRDEAADYLEAVDYKYGVDALPEFYEVRKRGGLANKSKLPKEKCEKVKECLNCSFGDIVEFQGWNETAYVWGPESRKPGEVSPWPRRASINVFALKAKVYRLNPITLFHALEVLQQAAPAALSHPILQTVWNDVFSAAKTAGIGGSAAGAGSSHHTASAAAAAAVQHSEGDALQSMASIVRVTKAMETERFAKRAGIVTEVEDFVETEEEKMLTSYEKSTDTKRLALKLVVNLTTWWPRDAQTQTFSMDDDKTFAARMCVILRAYEEHLTQWLPLRSVAAHVNLTPTLLAKFKAYMIFSRDLDSAFGFDATRTHQHTFHAPRTTNEDRMAEIQSMETGWLKRIAIDPVQCIDSVGVPVSAKEVPWLFNNFKRQVVRTYDAAEHNMTLSDTVVAMNSLSDQDFEAALSGGNHRFVAVSAGFVPTDAYTKVFEELHNTGAVNKGDVALASELFAESDEDGDFIEAHPIVRAATLPKIRIGEPCFVFAIFKKKYQHESTTQVLETLCKMLGYDENDKTVSVKSIMADIKAQADLSDSVLLPSLKRVEAPPAPPQKEDAGVDKFDNEISDADMLSALNEAEGEKGDGGDGGGGGNDDDDDDDGMME